MKKSFALTLFFLLIGIHTCLAQGHYIISHVYDPDKRHYYVGTLAKSSGSVYQKLKLEIFGGDFTGTDSGTAVYSITTRSGNIINFEKTGGSISGYDLKVFKNGSNYDFVIEINKSYVSLHVKSWLINGKLNSITEAKPVDITIYDSNDKSDATDLFTTKIMRSTDKHGNIGIGTLSPKSKLDVRGKIIADEVEVKVNEGADFVFSPDYKLKSLSEIETFVKENQHLPDIPSEKQMQEEGLNLNEMQIKLLQKIEELTLYVIDLKKENQQQQTVIENQNKRLEEYDKTLKTIIENK